MGIVECVVRRFHEHSHVEPFVGMVCSKMWSRGGYDAVFLETRDVNAQSDVMAVQAKCTMLVIVMFLQVADAETHPFNYQVFASFFIKLRMKLPEYWLGAVGVYVAVSLNRLVTQSPSG